MTAPPVTVTVDVTELNRALARLHVASKKSAAVLVNKKAYWICLKAIWNTPKTPAAKIASELDATKATELVRTKSGKRWSRSKTNVKAFFGSNTSRKKEAPILALILQSRVKNSGRNLGYAAKPPWHESRQIAQSPWKGVNRATGAARMLAAMRKMYGAKMMSRAYLASGWLEAKNSFQKALAGKLITEGKTPPAVGEVKRRGKPKGESTVAQPGFNARAEFINMAWSQPDGGEALIRIGGPALQAAIDDEAGDTMRKAMEYEFKAACKEAGVEARTT